MHNRLDWGTPDQEGVAPPFRRGFIPNWFRRSMLKALGSDDVLRRIPSRELISMVFGCLFQPGDVRDWGTAAGPDGEEYFVMQPGKDATPAHAASLLLAMKEGTNSGGRLVALKRKHRKRPLLLIQMTEVE